MLRDNLKFNFLKEFKENLLRFKMHTYQTLTLLQDSPESLTFDYNRGYGHCNTLSKGYPLEGKK